MAAKAGTAYIDFQADLSTLNKQVTAALTPLTAKFGKVGTAAAVGLGGVTAAAAGAAAALASVGAEFDAASDTIRTKTGATGRELAKLEGTFKKVVSEVPASFEDAADAVGGLNQRLDATGRPLRHLSKQMLELSRLTGTELNSNIAAVTRLFGDWSVATRKQGPTLDKLFRLTQQTGIEFTNLAELMVQFGSPLRQLGFSFNEAAAMFARFEKEGVNLQTLLPGLRMGLKNIAIPTDELSALFSRLGVSAKEPHDALLQIFDVLSSEKIREADRTLLASSVFGGRAWADMKAAVEEGRFKFADLIGEMRRGNDTIIGTGRATSDMGEEWQKFVNTLKVAVSPLAEKVFAGLSDGVRALRKAFSRGWGAELIAFLTQSLPNAVKSAIQSLKQLWRESGVLRAAFGAVRDMAKKAWSGIVDIVQGAASVIRGVIKAISGVLTGNFRRAWDGVKDIFRGAVKGVIGIVKTLTAPIRSAAKAIGSLLVNIFEGAWDKVTDIFRGAANTLKSIVNWIISNVINRIPGVELDAIGGGVPDTATKDKGAQAAAIGGKITRPMAIVGEEAPTHPEYVLATNPAYRKRNIGLWQAAGKELGIPGFAEGGRMGTDTLDAVKSASSYIGDLADAPYDRLPGFMSGTGDYIRDKFAAFIRDKVSSIVESAADVVTGGMTGHMKYPGVSGDTDFVPALGQALSRMAQATGQAISVQSGARTLAEQAALWEAYQNGTGNLAAPPNPNAPHVRGIAADITPGRERFGNVAGRFGLGFTVPSESWHIQLLRKGGILEFFRKGGERGKGGGENRKGDVIQRPLPAALQKFNKVYPEAPSPAHYTAPKMPFDKIAMLAEFFGMPGVTMAQMTKGESDRAPGATGIDPGGTKGWGLWMITTSYNDAIANRLGGYPQLLNPIKNAIAAREVFRSQGLGAWYGDDFVTGSNLHWNGDFGNLVRADGTGGGGGGGEGSDKPDKPDKPTLEVSGTTALGLTDYISKRLAKRIEAWRSEIKRLVPLIAEYEEIHAAPYSEAGEELSGAERNLELSFNKTLLGNQEGLRDGLKKAISKVRGKGIPEIVEKLRKELSGLVGITGDAGAILATKSKIWQLEHPEEADVSDNLAEILSLEQQRSLELLRENEVLRRQTPVFSRLFTAAPFGGVFHSGGVVPGPLGADRAIIAQGGETITPAGTSPVEVTVVVQDGAVNPSAIDVRINDRLAQIARTSSPRGGVTGRKAVYG